MDGIIYFTPAFVAGLVFIPILLELARFFGLYTCVRECEAQVFTWFGKGLQFPPSHFGAKALLIPFFGKRYVVNTALRQHYLRNQMVNSEEGTPMGVGIWYEMQVKDPGRENQFCRPSGYRDRHRGGSRPMMPLDKTATS